MRQKINKLYQKGYNMSLDISIAEVEDVYCPHCGEIVNKNVVNCECSGGRSWYDFLEKIGYYVPYEQRTEENDWYGKDMELTTKQLQDMYEYIAINEPYNWNAINGLIANAVFKGNKVVINADW